VMGIVNVTPDSFSDGGQFLDEDKAVAHALELVRQGADLLDIGGESTRPNAAPVTEADELARVIPVIEKLSSQTAVPLSIDTMKPAVARAAIAAGASFINDVAACHRGKRGDGELESCGTAPIPHHLSLTPPLQHSGEPSDPMWQIVAQTGAGYVAMHMLGTPQTMQSNPSYGDPCLDVAAFFSDRLTRLESCGVSPEQVVFDVGIGFGKSVEHNLQLLAGLRSFTRMGRPMLLGVSRKSFIGALTGAEVSERLPGSLACACLAVEAGVQIIRTHDVAETVQAVRLTEAVLQRQK
jgi:dihydropteroate synthase